MNLLKKLTATTAVVVLASGLMTTGVSAASSSYVEAANKLAEKGIINNHSTDTAKYELNRNVLRQEIAALSRGVANLEKSTTCNNPFKDVTATTPNDWACYSIQPLKDNMLIADNEYFRPESRITKAEAVGMIVKAAYGDEYEFNESLQTKWQAQVVAFAVSKGLTKNFTDYNALATRGFIFEVAANTFSDEIEGEIGSLLCQLTGTCNNDKDGDKDDSTDNTETPVIVQGEASVTLSPESPNDGMVYAESDRAPLLAFDVTAGKTDVTLKSASLQFTGLGDAKSITKLAVYSDDIKVTRGEDKRFSGNSQTSTISFDRDVTVRAGETKTFVIGGTIVPTGWTGNSTYNQTMRVNLTGLEANATVQGANIVGPMLTPYAVYNNAELKYKNIATTGNMYLGKQSNLVSFNVRETERRQGMVVKTLTIENNGSANLDSLTNFELLANGEKLDAQFIEQRGKIIAVFNKEVAKGALVNFVVRATASDDLGDQLILKVTDVYAVGATSNISVKSTNENETVATTKTITGSAVNFSFVRDEANQISPDTDNVKIGDLVFVTTADYNANIKLTISNSSEFENLQIDGNDVDSNSEVKDITLNKGTTTLPVTVDVKSAATSGSVSFRAEVTQLQDAVLGDKLTTTQLNSTLNNNGLVKRVTVVNPQFRLSPVTVKNTTVVPTGNQQVVLYKGRIDVTGNENMLVNNLVFKVPTGPATLIGSSNAAGDDKNLQNFISGVTLNIGGKKFNGTVNQDTITFNSLYTELEGNAKNIQVLVTATLKEKSNITSDAYIQIVGDDSNSDVTLTSGNNFGPSNIAFSNTASTKVELTNSSTLSGSNVAINQNNDTILAGTNNALIGSFRLDSTNSDIYFESFKLKSDLTGAEGEKLNSTFNNVRLVEGSAVIAEGGYVVKSGSDYLIQFDNFNLPQSGNTRTIDVIADVATYNDNGGDAVAYIGEMEFSKIKYVSYDLNTSGTEEELTGVSTAKINIVPAVLTYSVANSSSSSLGTVKVTLDTGNNNISTLNLTDFVFNKLDAGKVASVTVNGQSLTLGTDAGSLTNAQFFVESNTLKFKRDITNLSNFDVTILLTDKSTENIILKKAMASANGKEISRTYDVQVISAD